MVKHLADLETLLGIKLAHPMVEGLWEEFLKQPTSPWMTKAQLEDCLVRLNLSELPTYEIVQAWDALQEQIDLLFGLSFLRYVIVIGSHPSYWLVKHGPRLENNPISNSMLELLVILSLIPPSLQHHHRRGIRESFANFNLNHLRNYIRNYYQSHQTWGIEPFGWTTYLAALGLLPIGQLQFMHHIFTDPYKVYQHVESKEIKVLCNPGLAINRIGQFTSVNGVNDVTFKTIWEETDETIIAHAVHPKGLVLNQVVHLDRMKWKCIIQSGSPVIDFHIPTGAKYDVDSIKQTFLDAISFFQHHYPEHPYSAFWCVSWLYSPQLPWIISNQSSKILAIQEQGYLCPATPGEKSLFSFVFHTEKPNLEAYQAKTSLEKDVIHFLNRNGKVNAGLFLYFFQDIDQFGQKPYLTSKDEATFQTIQPFVEGKHV